MKFYYYLEPLKGGMGDSMKHLNYAFRFGALFVIVTGTLAHFLYDWCNNTAVVGLFTPVNESIWEHMQLLFFPMLLYAFLLIWRLKPTYPGIPSALYAGILAGTALIPLFFYSYTAVLGKDCFVLDLSTFFVSIFIAFWLSYRFTLSKKMCRYTTLLRWLVCILFILFMLFTYSPPALKIFEDPAI